MFQHVFLLLLGLFLGIWLIRAWDGSLRVYGNWRYLHLFMNAATVSLNLMKILRLKGWL